MQELVALALRWKLSLSKFSKLIFISIALRVEDNELCENNPCSGTNHETPLFVHVQRSIM